MAFPAVLQTAQTECGLGVSASILQHYGRYQTVSDLRLSMEPGREGLNLLQVSNLLTDEGMEVGAYRAGSLEQLRDIGKPVILHWNNSHYVVLVRMRHDRVQIMDPGQGLRTISLEEAESSFSGSVLVPTPRDDFEKKSRNVFKDWQFHTFFTKQMFGQYALFILLLAITYSVTFAVPMVIQHVVDAQLKGEENVVVGITAGVIAGIAGYYLVSIARAATLASIVSSIGYKLLGDLFARLLKLPLTYFALRSPGDILYRLASVNILRDFLSSNLTEFVINIGTMIVILIFIAQQSGVVLLITCGVLSVLVVIWIVTARPTSQALDAEYSHASETQVIELDTINTVATMKMTGSATSTFGKWRETYLRSLASMRRRMVLQQGVLGSAAAVVQLGGPLILLLSSLPLVNNGTLTLGQAIATEGISALLFSSISSVMFGIMNIAAVDRAVARITDIQRYEPEQDEGTVTDVIDSDIELDNVSFTYPGGMAPVLSEVSLTVPEEQDIAIVGSSGSGKSTLAMLLCSLYSPVSGAIRVGGIDIRDYSLDALRSHIGYVPQHQDIDPSFPVTAQGVVAMGLSATTPWWRRVDSNKISSALARVNLEQKATERFGSLSGGQRQRVLIARAVVTNPALMLLDEPFNGLDTTSRDVLVRVLTELKQQGTGVVVSTHDYSLAEQICEQTAVFADGHVAIYDTNEALLHHVR